VRSSATAEDLPDLSFAGQQDTFLNVRGKAAVLEAIRRCWASLWTPRAIAYRMQMNVNQRAVAMGVVVQVMVPADVSGILFTANPATGNRSELVVNASFGLGQAVVGGDVTPDTYVLDRDSLKTKECLIGGKEQMIVPAVEQGTMTQSVPEGKRHEPTLSPEILSELASRSLDAETLFDGRPQDIEWAVADGKVWLLQSRPITKLPPPPLLDVAWDPPSEGAVLIRRQVVENMPEPLSPLFDELYLRFALEEAIDQFLVDFGMRIDFEVFMERPFFLTVNGYAFCRGSYRLSWRSLRFVPSLLCMYIKVVPRLLRNIKNQWRDEALPAYLERIEKWKSVDLGTVTDQQLLSGVRALAVADANYWFTISLMVAGAKVTDGLLNRYLRSWLVPGDLTSGMFLRGFPSKTIDAQVDLEAIATRIQDDASLCELVRTTPIGELLETMRQDPRARSVLKDIQAYLDNYGHQVYNLDFAEPTQGEDPSAVLLSLRALVNREGSDAPARQAELVQERDSLIEQTSSSLGLIRRWLFRKFLGWAQSYGPCREDALFYMGAAWSTLRRLALELGQRLVAVGTLTRPDDVFYLESTELVEAYSARSEDRARADLRQIVGRRRELRESRKRLHPPAIIPVGIRWELGPFDMSVWETQKRNASDADTLHGFAVSPGTVTGVATVVLSPADFEQMRPDTILVCPTTTPAWTPLLAQALGLVTDIGGILAHGSIVAREYGIPAVLGTGNGTQRIVTGQRITVDGDSGTVAILE
jgi:pyruvate,water dikinase